MALSSIQTNASLVYHLWNFLDTTLTHMASHPFLPKYKQLKISHNPNPSVSYIALSDLSTSIIDLCPIVQNSCVRFTPYSLLARLKPKPSPGLMMPRPPSMLPKKYLPKPHFSLTPKQTPHMSHDRCFRYSYWSCPIQQYNNNSWCPFSFFSRKLTPTETCYSTFDTELLAIYQSIRHFRHLLEGRTFHVLTDHKPLIYALSSRSDRHSPRQARQLDYISQFTSTIRHIQGSENVVADALSRIEANALLTRTPPVIDFVDMAAAQAADHRIRSLESSPNTTMVVKAIPLANSTDPLYCDTSTGHQRPLIPESWRRTVFDSLHSLSHPGIRATQKLITSRFVWPGINADVRRWTRACIQCQRAKIQRHTTSPLSTFPKPDARFSVIHIDLVGPLPPSKGYTYLLSCVD